MLRGSGLLWDLRVTDVYEHYNLFKFSVPVGVIGDCYDRYVIRLEEMRESVNIIVQCLDALIELAYINNFEYMLDDNKITTPRRAFMKYSMESMIHHFKLYTEGVVIDFEDTYTTVEAPKGEFGLYLMSNLTNKPYRCRIKAPGFLHLQGLNMMMGSGNAKISDLVAVIGTQDLVFGEIDR